MERRRLDQHTAAPGWEDGHAVWVKDPQQSSHSVFTSLRSRHAVA